ncbi:MAG: hypothetical protein PHQ66_03290 [Candidatus Nanoarchaeia archaeon]|nr:hypothetical protein [Candidatus Nanoarchaeia archaeon]MDD5357613.1 hypothetical protein [Candidatus Nanoarchaeia archaeon]MDD5588532.1 hypothetical protein [Candidatus Nanoarchaeia archaeon]
MTEQKFTSDRKSAVPHRNADSTNKNSELKIGNFRITQINLRGEFS